MLSRKLTPIEKHITISETLTVLLYFLLAGYFFELYWQVYAENTPLNNWILLAYILPPCFFGLDLADRLTKQNLTNDEAQLYLKKSKEKGMKTVKLFSTLLLISLLVFYDKLHLMF